MTKPAVSPVHLWCALLTLGLAPTLRAQDAIGLPAFAPISPVAQSRSGLYAPAPSLPTIGWRWSTSLDYASLIEYNIQRDGSTYLLDAEVSRLNFTVGRDLSPRYFLELGGNVGSSEPGFLDGFLNWYHGLFGFRIPERALRPINGFAYRMDLPGGATRSRESGTHVGDLRLSVGRRHNARLQTVLTATLPNANGGEGYSRGVPSFSAITTVLAPMSSRVSYQGSVGLGYTAANGDLSRFQKEVFGSVTSGLGVRVWGHQYLYSQVFYHTPYYVGTNYGALDKTELSLNYGWMLRAAGRTWRIGMTEDLTPSGPAVDATFEFGVTWE